MSEEPYSTWFKNAVYRIEEAHVTAVMQPPTFHLYMHDRWIASCPSGAMAQYLARVIEYSGEAPPVEQSE